MKQTYLFGGLPYIIIICSSMCSIIVLPVMKLQFLLDEPEAIGAICGIRTKKIQLLIEISKWSGKESFDLALKESTQIKIDKLSPNLTSNSPNTLSWC